MLLSQEQSFIRGSAIYIRRGVCVGSDQFLELMLWPRVISGIGSAALLWCGLAISRTLLGRQMA